MAVNPPNFGLINQQAGQIVIDARNVIQRVIFFNQYIQTLGQDGLVALGFAAEDATLMLAIYANLSTVADVCLGEAYTGPTLPFNFLGQTVPLWGGQ
jgi:hypothetical protein